MIPATPYPHHRLRYNGGATSATAVRGFTLVEVLLAILIFGIMMTTLYSAFHIQFFNTEAVGQNMQVYETAQACLSRMRTDLTSIYVTERTAYNSEETKEKPDVYRVIGQYTEASSGSEAKLRFTSHAHTEIATRMSGGIAEIVYYMDPLEEGRYFLRRADYNVFEAPEEVDGQDPVLCDNVTSMKFLYYDEDGREHDTWDSDADRFGFATPRAVRIQLEIGSEERTDRFETLVSFPVYRDKATEEL